MQTVPTRGLEASAGEHPGAEVLLRFLRCAASPEERREVVRHLLRGCRECVAVTRPVWLLGDDVRRPKSRRKMGG